MSFDFTTFWVLIAGGEVGVLWNELSSALAPGLYFQDVQFLFMDEFHIYCFIGCLRGRRMRPIWILSSASGALRDF